jgi:hypothetical protein
MFVLLANYRFFLFLDVTAFKLGLENKSGEKIKNENYLSSQHLTMFVANNMYFFLFLDVTALS